MRDVGFSVAQVNEALLTEKCADRSSAAGTDGARTRQLLAEVDDAIARLQTIRNDLADSCIPGTLEPPAGIRSGCREPQ